jgi:hypothetical protein
MERLDVAHDSRLLRGAEAALLCAHRFYKCLTEFASEFPRSLVRVDERPEVDKTTSSRMGQGDGALRA